MTSNVGGWDRNTRWVLGAGALIAAVAAPLPRGWKFGLLSFAATELLTAATQYCPVNRALGINTSRERIAQAAETALNVARKVAV
jgi:hypothetical protein